MRRTLLSVVLGAVVVLIAVVALPGLGIGATTTSHGLTPTDAFTNTDPEVCHVEKVGPQPVSLLPTAVHVGEESLVVAYFTSTWSAPSGSPDELLLALKIGDDSSPEWIANTGTGGSERAAHGVGTVMWSFPNVPAGDYTVEATAHIAGAPGTSGQSGANLQGCALTVVVSPMA
jgi:hypothetical protein